MISLLLLLHSAAQHPPAPPVQPQAFCARTSREHLPAPVDVLYTVIGKEPRSGRLYAGSLSSRFLQGRYVLVREADGAAVPGEAWAVLCGPDKVPLLEVRYETKPVATHFYCTMSVNYDNYSLASCGPTSNASQSAVGLEAWYPAPAGAP